MNKRTRAAAGAALAGGLVSLAYPIFLRHGNWVWIFALVAGDGQTRLISRNRIATPGAPPPVRLFNLLLMEPGSLVMERKMLLGIKQRAEGLVSG